MLLLVLFILLCNLFFIQFFIQFTLVYTVNQDMLIQFARPYKMIILHNTESKNYILKC